MSTATAPVGASSITTDSGTFDWDIDPETGTGLLRAPFRRSVADWRRVREHLASLGLRVDVADNFWFKIGEYEYRRLVPIG